MITQDELKQLLHYDPETGAFTWLVANNNSIKVGDIAGCIYNEGYRQITIDNKHYRAHRLAWLYCHGYLPENDIDHINRICADNRIINLREVSRQCNVRNTGNHCTNTSGVKGVSCNRRDRKWMARIKVNGKLKHLGYYTDFDDAVCARLSAEQCLDWAGCDSSSPAYKHVQRMLCDKFAPNCAAQIK